jgi:hypothetical protein
MAPKQVPKTIGGPAASRAFVREYFRIASSRVVDLLPTAVEFQSSINSGLKEEHLDIR